MKTYRRLTAPRLLASAVLLATLIAAPLTAAEPTLPLSGVLETRTIPLPDIALVSAGGRYTIEIRRGSPARLELTTDDNLFDAAAVRTDGDELLLSVEPYNQRFSELSAVLYLPVLPDVSLAGGVSATVIGEWATDGGSDDQWQVSMAGGASLTVDGLVRTRLFAIQASGGAVFAGPVESARNAIARSGGAIVNPVSN